MKASKIIRLSFIIILSFLNFSCSSIIYKTVYPTLSDGQYDSEFPYKSSSKQLDEIGNSIIRINSIAFYKTYGFDFGEKVDRKNLQEKITDDKSIKSAIVDKTSSGTATVISSDAHGVALLTCAHVVYYPDTLITHYTDSQGKPTDYIQSFSIKTKQNIYAAGYPEGGELNIISLDPKLDLAILAKKFSHFAKYSFPVFNYPFGKAKELQWGSFVYILGYPLNYKMITKALVSSPNFDNNGGFLIDAVVNRGCSGGIVLAIRDGIPNFELVGVVDWVPEEKTYVLSPDFKQDSNLYNPIVPYTGVDYVKSLSNLKYGIAKIIPIESILDFLKTNKQKLENEGFHLKIFEDKEKAM